MCNSGYGQERTKCKELNAPSDPKWLALWHKAMPKTDLKLRNTDKIPTKHFPQTPQRQGTKRHVPVASDDFSSTQQTKENVDWRFDSRTAENTPLAPFHACVKMSLGLAA